jgi:hypothetical protein
MRSAWNAGAPGRSGSGSVHAAKVDARISAIIVRWRGTSLTI